MQFRARSVRYSETFESQREIVEPDAQRFDEQIRGIEWAIAREPEQYPLMEDTVLRRVTTTAWPDAPTLRIFFVIDNKDLCTLVWVELA